MYLPYFLMEEEKPWATVGKQEGGEIVAGGKYDNASGGHFVHPTVFSKTNADMTLVKEEIFGPVVCAQPFSDENLEKINIDVKRPKINE